MNERKIGLLSRMHAARDEQWVLNRALGPFRQLSNIKQDIENGHNTVMGAPQATSISWPTVKRIMRELVKRGIITISHNDEVEVTRRYDEYNDQITAKVEQLEREWDDLEEDEIVEKQKAAALRKLR